MHNTFQNLFLIICLTFLAGCVSVPPLVTETEITKDYEVGETKTVNVGDAFVSVLRTTNKFHDGYYTDIPVSLEQFAVRLTYLGLNGTSIVRLQYREFQDAEYARPIYDLDLGYDLQVSDTLIFRDLSLIVSDATSSSITYRIIADTPNSIFP